MRFIQTPEAQRRMLQAISDNGELTMVITRPSKNEVLITGKHKGDAIVEMGPITIHVGDELSIEEFSMVLK